MLQGQRILVIRRRYLGDLVLLGSFLRNLRLHWSAAHIAVLAEPAYADVLALNPDVNAAVAPPAGVFGWPRFTAELRRGRLTHVFNFDNTEQTALITRLSGAPFRLALHHGGYRVKLRGLYTHVVNHPNDEHETQPITEYYLRALPAAGVPVATREVRLVPRASDLTELGRFTGAAGPVLLVHPGSRSSWRVWPAERFAAVIDRVQDELGFQAILVGGPGEKELLAEIRRRTRTHLLALDDTPGIARLAALARLSAAVLCHDSGPMHVAAAVGTPVVALYGSQNPVLFGPTGEGHILLTPPLPCVACVAPDRCVPGDSYRNLCVRRHTVESVYDAVRTQLMRARAQPR